MNLDLTLNEKMDSMDAFKEFHNFLGNDERNFNVRAYVFDPKGTKVVFSNIVNITVDFNHNTQSINIYWEDANLENYGDYSLKGTYVNTTTRATFINDKLKLDHKASDRIVLLTK